jgi:fumarylpyruvate hydrolase
MIELPVITVEVLGEDARFPVGRIFCVGRNYADHAIEMGADPVREPPFFFTKQPTAILADGAPLPYPPLTEQLHYEVELVVAIGHDGGDIAPAQALSHVFGYAVGIDMTRRDRQDEAKALRRPWDLSKSFDGAAPLGALTHTSQAVPGGARITLAVDDRVRQSDRISSMIWTVPEIIAELSRYQPLRAGDLIYTGTPAGVGPVDRGSKMVASVDGLAHLVVDIPAV